jgi:hypothetical protein
MSKAIEALETADNKTVFKARNKQKNSSKNRHKKAT